MPKVLKYDEGVKKISKCSIIGYCSFVGGKEESYNPTKY
jgi:hypothetical protein